MLEKLKKIPSTPWGMLPPHLRILMVVENQDMARWLNEAFELERVCNVELHVASNPALALELIRDDAFDGIIVGHESDCTLDWIEALRVGLERYQPILVFGRAADVDFSAMCFEAGADGFLTLDTMTTRELLWHCAKASEKKALLDENELLKTKQKNQIREDHERCLDLIAEQGTILSLLYIDSRPDEIPVWLQNELQQLLEFYVLQATDEVNKRLYGLVERALQENIEKAGILYRLNEIMVDAMKYHGPGVSENILNRGNVLIFELLTIFERLQRSTSTSS